jgi:hypothetical protein
VTDVNVAGERERLREAFLAGFRESERSFNYEFPFDSQDGTSPTSRSNDYWADLVAAADRYVGSVMRHPQP